MLLKCRGCKCFYCSAVLKPFSPKNVDGRAQLKILLTAQLNIFPHSSGRWHIVIIVIIVQRKSVLFTASLLATNFTLVFYLDFLNYISLSMLWNFSEFKTFPNPLPVWAHEVTVLCTLSALALEGKRWLVSGIPVEYWNTRPTTGNTAKYWWKSWCLVDVGCNWRSASEVWLGCINRGQTCLVRELAGQVA